MSDTEPYRIDPERVGLIDTGIAIRALDGATWISADISELDQPSLHRWLRSRGGENEFAENVVYVLLGHVR